MVAFRIRLWLMLEGGRPYTDKNVREENGFTFYTIEACEAGSNTGDKPFRNELNHDFFQVVSPKRNPLSS